jgi:hypothetical protein
MNPLLLAHPFIHLSPMTRGLRAKSIEKKRAIYRAHFEDAVELAVDLYRCELRKPQGEKRLGLAKIASNVRAEYVLLGHPVKLSPQTILNRHKGVLGYTDSRERVRNLSKEQSKALMDYIISMAEWGWPATSRMILDWANSLRRESGQKPITGRNWVPRWVLAHPEIAAYRPKGHESKRGQAANLHNLASWFDLYGDVVMARRTFSEYPDLTEPVAAECIYAMDESGFQPYGAPGGNQVYGKSGKKNQYQQRDGTRETITVLTTICADGSTLPPAVIFKGEGFLIKWSQDNPLNAS